MTALVLANLNLPALRTLRDAMFRPTITARMLRLLMEHSLMPQAEFMQRYHVMCNRPGNTAPSSFGNNFGRYCVTWRRTGSAVVEQRNTRTGSVQRGDVPPHSGRNLLAWVGPSITQFLLAATTKELDRDYQRLESQMATVTGPDHVADLTLWMSRIHNESARRTA